LWSAQIVFESIRFGLLGMRERVTLLWRGNGLPIRAWARHGNPCILSGADPVRRSGARAMKTVCLLLAGDHAPAWCDWPRERRRGKVFLPADSGFA
jgi:hypothetical protein